MPLHNWHCDGCGNELEVLRSIGQHAEPPTPTEVADAKMPADCPSEAGHQTDSKPHLWRKRIKGAPGAVRSPGWGKKGYW